MSKLIATCAAGGVRDIRDRAILMVAFASGGRRRSEIVSLRIEQLKREEPIQTEVGSPLPPLSIHPPDKDQWRGVGAWILHLQ